MPVAVFPIGPLETNAYVFHGQRDAVAIDPGGDMRGGLSRVTAFLAEHKLALQAVILTHLHFDHVLGVAELAAACGEVAVYGGKGDDELVQSSFRSSTWGVPPVKPFAYADLPPGEHCFGGISCVVFATPGHSPGSLSIYMPQEDVVFVGDLLFHRSVGRTDLPGSNHQDLVQSLRLKIYTLPPQTVAYPGHGISTVVGEEMHSNPFVRA